MTALIHEDRFRDQLEAQGLNPTEVEMHLARLREKADMLRAHGMTDEEIDIALQSPDMLDKPLDAVGAGPANDPGAAKVTPTATILPEDARQATTVHPPEAAHPGDSGSETLRIPPRSDQPEDAPFTRTTASERSDQKSSAGLVWIIALFLILDVFLLLPFAIFGIVLMLAALAIPIAATGMAIGACIYGGAVFVNGSVLHLSPLTYIPLTIGVIGVSIFALIGLGYLARWFFGFIRSIFRAQARAIRRIR